MDWGQLLAVAMPILITVIFFLLKGKAEKILRAMSELGDVLKIIPEVLEDQKITPEEMVRVKREIAEALAAFRAVLK